MPAATHLVRDAASARSGRVGRHDDDRKIHRIRSVSHPGGDSCDHGSNRAITHYVRPISTVRICLACLWGLVATAAPVGWWSWIAKTSPENAEAGGGLVVAVIQLSIALGSTVGGVFFDGMGYQATFTASAVPLTVAATLAVLTARTQH